MAVYTPYELGRFASRTNGVNNMKEFQLRDIKERIKRDFLKSFDAETVKINNREQLVLITRDKGDEQIKKIKSLPDERFDLGNIVNWNGVNYIIYKMDADRRIQSKGRMYECNMKLRWKNANGDIIERVGKGEDATKYSEGTEGGRVLRIGEFQLKVLVTLDAETSLIRRDDRFIIDADKFVENMIDNGVMPNVFRVTRRNVITGTFPDTGYVEITLVEDQFVAGVDDIDNMIAPRVSTIINQGLDPEDEDSSQNSENDGNSNVGDNNEGNNNESTNEEEGSWL